MLPHPRGEVGGFSTHVKQRLIDKRPPVPFTCHHDAGLLRAVPVEINGEVLK
jgi:hypothetical protein